MAIETKLAVILHADIVGSTALVQKDERVSHERIQDVFRRLSETISSHGGTTHEIRGDALVAEFERTSDAVAAALAFQSANTVTNQTLIDDIKPEVRIGIALGEVVIADTTLTGVGVVLAQRLEQLAAPSGTVIQGAIQEAVPRRLPFEYIFLGEQSAKGFDDPIRAFSVELTPGADAPAPAAREGSRTEIGLVDQSAVRYCLSGDGVSIAYAQVGEGYPLVFGGSWMTHLEKDWEHPGWGHYPRHLAKDFTVIRYDQRGNGLSDWDGVDISFEKMVDDLERVIDCYDYEKVAIFGASQAAPVAIAYTRRHPERVSHLILYGGYARGRRRRGEPKATAESEALATLIRQGWGRDNPAFRQTITSLFMPDATQEEAAWFNDFQRACGPAENIARFREVFDEIDVSSLLDDVNVPTLVVHCVEDSVAPISEGKLLATRIPSAQFVTLNSKNHIMLEREPVFPRFLQSVRNFLRSV